MTLKLRQFFLLLTLLFSLNQPALSAPVHTVLRIGLPADPDILDPALSGSFIGRVVFAGMCDKLFDYNASLKIIPQLATSYVYTNPTHLVLKLRPGVLFQDGEHFNAQAVKFTLDRDLSMKGSLRRGQINDIASIKTIGPLTVELILKAPDSSMLAQLAGRPGIMIAPAAAAKEGRNFGLHPVCAGPFRFVKRIPEQKIVLKRFKRYWDAKAIHFNKVEYYPIVNPSVMLANLQAGRLDIVTGVDPTDVGTVERDSKLRILLDTSLGYSGITFNVANGPESKTAIGQHARLRQAFNLAIDRAALIHVVEDGYAVPVAQANPPSSRFFIKSIVPPLRNIKAAIALVKSTGVPTPIPVSLLVPNSPALLQMAQVIQAMVKPAGFDVKIRAMEFASSLAAAQDGDFQAYLDGWSGRADADGNMYSFLHSGEGFNYGKYDNPKINRFLDLARTVESVAGRKSIYAKIWKIEAQDMPIIYLFSPNNIVALNRDINGFVLNPDGIIRLQGMFASKTK
jgi:peptide/nickel transport system substrate-binding protein